MRIARLYLLQVARFLFCAYRYHDELVGGPLTVVYTTTRETFEQEGHIDDGYDDEDGTWERLLDICDEHGMGELMESVWESVYSPDEIKARLEREPDVAYSPELLSFILAHEPMGGEPYEFPDGCAPAGLS